MAIVADLTPTAVPSTDTNGGIPLVLFHVKVTSAGGAGTYTFSHGLPYTPTVAWVIGDQAEGTNPSTSNLGQATACYADFSSTKVAINLAGNATYHVIYG